MILYFFKVYTKETKKRLHFGCMLYLPDTYAKGTHKVDKSWQFLEGC